MSIQDWYLNQEGRYEGFNLDWENDDLPDRNRDAWLDRIGSGSTDREMRSRVDQTRLSSPQPHERRRVEPRRKPRGETAPPLRTQQGKPSDEDLARLVRQILVAEPGLPYREVARRLRSNGLDVFRSDISRAMKTNATWVRPTTSSASSTRAKGVKQYGVFLRAVRKIMLNAPDLRAEDVAARLTADERD